MDSKLTQVDCKESLCPTECVIKAMLYLIPLDWSSHSAYAVGPLLPPNQASCSPLIPPSTIPCREFYAPLLTNQL
ncbi:hypothetical protein DSO57_1022463 [Entomophthora muscae]|uniref:Uncharacterized protein n=1 Tax=Entomophthora muscae TaxID=34485 RepID=A0ACC2U1L3_9FUNG|nr:hypothetical protein DSO57_1022463 [Entomophthora muscae]